jgi:hypothetical protein
VAAGALALAVGVAFDDELVAGGGEPVDGGLGQQLVVHEAEPFNRGWDMFGLGDLCCCLPFSGLSRFRDL